MKRRPLFLLLLTAPLSVVGAQEKSAPERIAAGQTCVDCHRALTEGHNSHSPVREGKCALCHLQSAPERHAFSLPKDLGAVCASCHALPQRTTTHAPVAKNDCLACHTAHPSASEPYRRNLLAQASERVLCAQCHAGESGNGRAFVHGPVAGGGCTPCHVPHSSEEEKLLRKPAAQGCLDCHADVHAQLEGAVSRHPPVLECLRCHDPHASDQRFELAKEPRKLCLDCHAPLLQDLESRPVFHQALQTDRGCANCHAAHASGFPKLLERPVSELCARCHSQPIRRADGRTIAPVGEEVTKAEFLHGPIREGDCDACHDPHGSRTFSLLREPYPQDFYAPFEVAAYGLCFRCHAAESFTTSSSETLTHFRDGARNLHFLHVNQSKGRTCRACHETHASDLPAHLAKEVPFGSWSLPIQFERLPGGGACTPGCHERKEYRFERAPPPAGKNP